MKRGPMLDQGGLRYRSGAGRWVIAATVLGSGMASVDATVVGIALPTIGREFHASIAQLQWVVNGYTLTLAALLLVGGSLGDRFGRRRVFTIGVIWFTVASAACALAPGATTLIALRVLQGVGGALLTPGSLAILQASFREEDRGQAIGAWTGLGGVASATGPFIGGWLIAVASWRWIFFINLPIGLAVLLLAIRHVPESRDESAPDRVDVPGALLVMGALAGITYGLIEGPAHGWHGPSINPYVMPASAPITSSAPGTSTRSGADSSRDSGTCRMARSSTASPMGRLMKKIHRQEATAISQPPMNGPVAEATPPRPVHAPMAWPRSSSRNDAWRMARLPGVSRAPPTPCNIRKAISVVEPGASAQAAEATVNQMTPMVKTRRRPNRSPSDPPTRRRAASVSVYPLTTHWSWAIEAWNSRPMVGSAIPTTVASTEAIPEPSTVAAITHRPAPDRYRSPPWSSIGPRFIQGPARAAAHRTARDSPLSTAAGPGRAGGADRGADQG